MGNTAQIIESGDRRIGTQEALATQVQKVLSEILKSTPFRTSKQSQQLLRYIVDQTLAGHIELLKERVIGAEVFGRPPDYDTNDDPIVRGRAAEVRKRLAQYYVDEGHRFSIRIEISPGSYIASFFDSPRSQAKESEIPVLDPAFDRGPVLASQLEPLTLVNGAKSPQQVKLTTRARPFLGFAGLAIVMLLGALVYSFRPKSPVEQFWSPILDNPHTTLIYVGGNAVYQLSPSYLDLYYQQHPRSQTEEMGLESYIPLPPGTKIDAKDLYPAKDTFVTIGDVAAITRIESLLVRRNRQFNVRFGGDVAYGDLRESPTILVGAHNNSWTLTMTGTLHYVFDGRMAIVDRADPRKRWSSNAAFTEDYAIVSRVLNSKTGTTMITLAGVGFAGTQAAAEFVTNPQSISALIKSLPKGWEKKNLQIVLHTTVTNRIPGTADVVATYCW